MAKSLSEKFFSFIRHTAKASPVTRVAVVELIGACPSGHASFSTPTLIVISAYFPNVELGFPVKPTIFPPIFLIGDKILKISSEFPLFDMAITTSPLLIIPKSPCNASAAFKNTAVVPVEARVAAIFSPIIPDFPIPVTTTLLFLSSIIVLTNF